MKSNQLQKGEARKAHWDGGKNVSALALSYVADVSHELRGPLNVILGMTELLGDMRLTARQRELLDNIRSSGEILISSVNEMADFVGMAVGGLRLTSLDFSPRTLVEDMGDLVAEKASARGLELIILVDHDVPERMTGDPTQLRRVLTTLVNSAIRRARGGEIVVRAELAVSGPPGSLRFSVEYDGPAVSLEETRMDAVGFPDEDMLTLRGPHPTGPQLAMIGQIVRRMGGVLEVERLDGGRSRMAFDARLEPVSGEEQIAQEPDVQLGGLKVLVVDDSEANRKLLEEILRSSGCQTAVAAGGAEALDRLHEAEGTQPFDLAILDFVMPDMDGVTLASAIRAHLSAASMPMILLTSAPAAGDAERMREAGFDAYLTKPVTRADLTDTVRWVLSRPARARGGLITRHTLRETRRTRLRILLVDDDELNQKTIAAMLERLGYRCDLAANGRAAVQALARREYDVVLMDYEMPVMDGFEATRRIREREKETRRRTPIIATTADTLAGNRDRLREIGMDEYVPKPIDIRELAEVLARLTGEEVPAPQSLEKDQGAEPVDISRLELMSGNDVGFLKKIIFMFLDESESRLGALKHALEAADFETVHGEAHALKGAAGNLGAREVSEAAATLQQAAKAEDRGECVGLLATLQARMEEAGRWLKAYAGRLPAGPDGA
ncbi:MAG: response regulator [Acidobacteria bacterium]|nr:response regulator [Acidobacteriota bacterium]